MVDESTNYLHWLTAHLGDQLAEKIRDREQRCAKPELSDRDYWRDTVVDILSGYAKANGRSFAEMDRELSPAPRIRQTVNVDLGFKDRRER